MQPGKEKEKEEERVRFHPIEDARGSAWRQECPPLDRLVVEAVSTLISHNNRERFAMQMESLLLTADCLVYERRLSDAAYWNYVMVNHMAREGTE